MIEHEPPPTGVADAPHPASARLDGVVIGVLLGFAADGRPLVAFPGNPPESAVPARYTSRPSAADLGREVALLFENADPASPVLIGVVQHPAGRPPAASATAQVDGERLVLRAERELVLACGKARITLTRAGKVLISGTYVSSRSSGMQRLKGASIEIN
jgi:hypothetical protein